MAGFYASAAHFLPFWAALCLMSLVMGAIYRALAVFAKSQVCFCFCWFLFVGLVWVLSVCSFCHVLGVGLLVVGRWLVFV